MKLSDCHLWLRTVVTPPFEHDAPDDEWHEAHRDGEIPEELWDFYRATRYLSASALAGFDTAEARVVTVYFARLLSSIKACFADAADLRAEMRSDYPRQYDPRRLYPNEFDRHAARRHRSAFRSLLGNLVGALDVFADTAIVMLPGQIPKVHAGSAAFTDVERWLRGAHDLPVGIVSPAQHFATELFTTLRPLVVVTDGPERDWLPLLRMYRNKSAHLGHQSYTQFGLETKEGGGLSFFIPRSWPFVAEQHATTGLPSAPANSLVDFSDVLNDWLMHQDIEEYSDGAVRKITQVIGTGLAVLRQAYQQLGRVPLAEETLRDLEKNRQSYKFEFFESAD